MNERGASKKVPGHHGLVKYAERAKELGQHPQSHTSHYRANAGTYLLVVIIRIKRTRVIIAIIVIVAMVIYTRGKKTSLRDQYHGL